VGKNTYRTRRLNMPDNITRTLLEICEEVDFSINLEGNIYCSLAISRQIECPYQDLKKDHNERFQCLNSKYNKNNF